MSTRSPRGAFLGWRERASRKGELGGWSSWIRAAERAGPAGQGAIAEAAKVRDG